MAQAFPFDATRGYVTGTASAAAVLKRGDNLIWFPEGWLSRTGELQPFMRGIGMLLARYPVPIVPVAIAGSHEDCPKGRRTPRPRPSIDFGEALDPDRLRREGEGETVEDRTTSVLHAHTAKLYEGTSQAPR